MISSSIKFEKPESPKKVKIKIPSSNVVSNICKTDSPKKGGAKDSPVKKGYASDGSKKSTKVKEKDIDEEKVDLKNALKSLKMLKKFFLKLAKAIKSTFCICNSSNTSNNELLT
jgi:hypothetical protein